VRWTVKRRGGGGKQISVPVSALNHYTYCPRRCYLIHQEQLFEENVYTIQGANIHEHVDVGEDGTKGNMRVHRSLPIWHRGLGLYGVADMVEWYEDTPYPVEYKRGKKRRWLNDDVQLCAQAMCIEEMLDIVVPEGAVYHHASRHRRRVPFDPTLRSTTVRIINEVHSLLQSSTPPPPTLHRTRCNGCSLRDTCLPDAWGLSIDELVVQEEHT
jgi:CRISPR-associated exonuclease Cas4